MADKVAPYGLTNLVTPGGPATHDVRMPDGTIIRGVPVGTTRAQLMAKLAPRQGPLDAFPFLGPAAQLIRSTFAAPTGNRNAGIAARATVKGLEDVTAPFRATSFDPLGVQPTIDQKLDVWRLPRPETKREKLAAAAVEGAAASAPFALGGGGIVSTLASGGGAGAASEFAKQKGYGPAGQLLASLGGGLAAGATVNKLGQFGRSLISPPQLSETAQAFQRQDVPFLPAMTDSEAAKMGTGVTHMTVGGLPLEAGMKQSYAGARAARDRIAGNIGEVSDTTGAGNAAISGIKEWIGTTKNKTSALYDKIPIEGNQPTTLDNTRQALKEITQGFESNPELSKLWAENPRLRASLEAISEPTYPDITKFGYGKGTPPTSVPGIAATPQTPGLSWGDTKRLRTIIGQMVGQPSLTSDGSDIAALRKLYAGLSEDMRATAFGQGPQALHAFERANSYAAGRSGRIDRVLSDILGPDMHKSGQGAFSQIENWASTKSAGDAAKLGQTLRSMPADEAATVRATLFSRLGNATPGAQDLTGTAFSANTFATQWNKLSDRAKAVLFPNPAYRRDINDMARIADAMKGMSKYANTSRTSLGTNAAALATMGFYNPLAAIVTLTGQLGAGKLLASERFARWLATSRTALAGPSAAKHIRQLTVIAAAEPQISNEVLAIQKRLADAFGQAPLPLAAQSGPVSGQQKSQRRQPVPQ